MGLKFALTGAAGYIAPRHMRAIKENNSDLVAAYDKSDSVGILDRYFPEATFFTEFERFDRHINKLCRMGHGMDYLSICAPSHVHDMQCRFGLMAGSDVICEKPLVLNPWNVDALQEVENQTSRKIYTILQMRLHPSIQKLKREVEASPPKHIFQVDITYFTARGKWFDVSWKGDQSKSGGITTNIGIHFFDALIWIFGDKQSSVVHIREQDRAAGFLELEKANVRWVLSTNPIHFSKSLNTKNQSILREITIDGEKIDVSEGLDELHTQCYSEILKGAGFGTQEVKKSIIVAHEIRNSPVVGLKGDYHPLAIRNPSNRCRQES